MGKVGIVLTAALALSGNLRAEEPPPLKLYAQPAAVISARLSPDGKRVALIATYKGRQVLYVHSLEEGGKDGKIVSFDDSSVGSVSWKDNDHLIAGIRKTEKLPGSSPPIPEEVSRLISVDASGDNVKPIGGEGLTGPGYDRIRTMVIHNGFTARAGLYDDHATGILARSGTDEPWHEIRRIKIASDETFTALAFLPGSPKMLYVLSDGGPDGKAGLWSFDITTSQFVDLIDGEAALRSGTQVENGELLGYLRRDGTHVYLDPAWQADYLTVCKAMKGAEVTIIDRAADGLHVLFEVHKPHQPKVWWILDRTVKPLNLWPAVEQYPNMPAERVAPVTDVSYTARDGLTIPAYLTLPAAYKEGPIPFIILPHDGPNTCEEKEFDYVSQFLASRGWGVLRPLYRGTACHGPEAGHVGYEDWPGSIQDEIADGTHWLIGQHYADPSRICIVGDGFGGYSALQGVIKEPDLYRCAAAWAPVTDFFDLHGGSLNKVEHPGDLERYLNRHGRPDYVLEPTSPLPHADSIKVPVLLMHGREDATTNIHQSELMAETLRGESKPVEAIYLDHADHYRQDEASRTAWLSALDRFLGAQLGKP